MQAKNFAVEAFADFVGELTDRQTTDSGPVLVHGGTHAMFGAMTLVQADATCLMIQGA